LAPQARTLQPQRLGLARRVEHHQIGRAALADPVVLDPERRGRPAGDHVEQRAQLVVAAHVPEVGEHERGLQRVAETQRVPRVHHRVVPDRHIHPGREQLLHPGVPAPDRSRVEAPLENRIVQRVRHHVQPGAGDVRSLHVS